MSDPRVSVVMGVYNGAADLPRTMESILSQEGVDLEFIVVDDGATDESPQILADYARRDARVRVIRQENAGLTRALIRGCADARGHYIARQDVGDVSLPERLRKQVAYLDAHAETALLSCWVRFVGPKGEELYVVQRKDTPEEAAQKLRAKTLDRFQGIGAHGSAVFRRCDYLRAGGYREQFYFAQDTDMWRRLAELGLVAFLPEVLFEVEFTPAGISGQYAAEQMQLGQIVVELGKAREEGRNEADLLEKAAAIRPSARKRTSRQEAKGAYFVGKCLLDRGDRRGLGYLRDAIGLAPLWIKPWVVLARHALVPKR